MNKTIRSIHARRVWDSRGRPTVEAEVTLGDGATGRAIVPAGGDVEDRPGLGARQSRRHAAPGGHGARQVLPRVAGDPVALEPHGAAVAHLPEQPQDSSDIVGSLVEGEDPLAGAGADRLRAVAAVDGHGQEPRQRHVAQDVELLVVGK